MVSLHFLPNDSISYNLNILKICILAKCGFYVFEEEILRPYSYFHHEVYKRVVFIDQILNMLLVLVATFKKIPY